MFDKLKTLFSKPKENISDAESPLKVGDVLQNNKYVIERLLGQGDFGVTYLATNKITYQKVAIKEFFMRGFVRNSKNLVTSQHLTGKIFTDLKKRFLEDAKNLSLIDDHINIAKVTDCFEENNTAYYVMYFVEGISLQKYIINNGVLSEYMATNFILQIAEALKNIHTKKILHADIKPNNIIITEENKAVLTDFGTTRDFIIHQILDDSIALSKGYAAPEQYDAKQQRGIFTDIYGLGATFYTITTGEIPIDANLRTANNLKQSIQIDKKISLFTNNIIIKALEINPLNRFNNLDVFINLLNNNRCLEIIDNELYNFFGLQNDATSKEIFEKFNYKDNKLTEDSKLAPIKIKNLLENEQKNLKEAFDKLYKKATLLEEQEKIRMAETIKQEKIRKEIIDKQELEIKNTKFNEALATLEIPNETDYNKIVVKYNLLLEWYSKQLSSQIPAVQNIAIAEIPKINSAFEFILSYFGRGVLPEMVAIKGGNFVMGAIDMGYIEHQVEITDFYIAKYQITNLQFAKFINEYGSDKTNAQSEYSNQIMIYNHEWGLTQKGTKWEAHKGNENLPVIYVTWYGAYEYCKWLSEKTSEKYQLPTEAQWEYAALSRTNHWSTQKWAGTNDEKILREYAWYTLNADGKTHEVGTRKPNILGIHDMSGNVWEWCRDWYDANYYTKSNRTDPVNTVISANRTLRGGSWILDAHLCRIAYRLNYTPNFYSNFIGFRVCKNLV